MRLDAVGFRENTFSLTSTGWVRPRPPRYKTTWLQTGEYVDLPRRIRKDRSGLKASTTPARGLTRLPGAC